MRHAFSLIAAFAIAVPVALDAQVSDPAIAPVQALSDGLIATMKAGKTAGVRGREGVIGPVVDRTFDIPLMTRLAVGPAWTRFSSADQSAVVAAFRRMTVAQYADNFDSYSGQSFAVDPKVASRGGDRLVRTTLKDPHGSPVALAYRLRQGTGGWKIVDVFYNNSISQIATRRADFARVVQTGGARSLIQHLNDLAKAG